MPKANVMLTDAHHEQAKGLYFVGHGDGGPCVIVPRSSLTRYWGVFDEDGESCADSHSHYQEAIDASGALFRVGDDDVFVLHEEAGTSFVPSDGGGYLVRWVGAKSAAAVLGVALTQKYRPLELRRWRVPAGGLVLLHGTVDGRTVTKAVDAAAAKGSSRPSKGEPFLIIDLPAGEYAVDDLEASEFDGDVKHPDGSTERVMVRAFRLRRVGDYGQKPRPGSGAGGTKEPKGERGPEKRADAKAKPSTGGTLPSAEEAASKLEYVETLGGLEKLWSAEPPPPPKSTWKDGAAVALEHVSLRASGAAPPVLSLGAALAYLGGTPKQRRAKEWDFETPEVVRPLVKSVAEQVTNHFFDRDRQERLLPLLPRILASRSGGPSYAAAGQLAMSWYVTVGTPYWLELAGLESEADEWRKRSAPTSFAELAALRPLLDECRAKLDAERPKELPDASGGPAARSAAILFQRSGACSAWILSNVWQNAMLGGTDDERASTDDLPDDAYSARTDLAALGKIAATRVATARAREYRTPKKASDAAKRQFTSVLLHDLAPLARGTSVDAIGLLEKLLP
ncbi:MAG: hypothetical protein KF764_05575 [Labilithrix sp.]|nr:hypothetical protein [Labilithrix sp.]